MALTVKAGREYVLGGVVYKSGADVPENQIPAKYRALLTSAKGPLSAEGPASSPTDLPKAAMPAATVEPDPEPEPVEEPMPEPIEEAAPEAAADPRTDTRDIAQTGGRTGAVKPSRSSRLVHRQKRKS